MSYKVKSTVDDDVLVVGFKASRTKGKKKSSKQLKGAQRMVDESSKALETFASGYRARHKKSSSKKRDGWLRDMDDNVFKATRKSVRKVKLDRVLGF
ncbi:hypothetical protein [Planktotalea sp.]|uniref:DUF6312 domain-containing protein n=1 Tax=Planktotalea sp. TaxID=2029877 RepID=UPI003297DBBD